VKSGRGERGNTAAAASAAAEAASQWNNIHLQNAERNPLKTKAQWKAKAINGVQCSCEGQWKPITYLRKCKLHKREKTKKR